MANLSTFYLQVNLSGSVAQPNNSSTFQIVAPWGASGNCYTIEEALEQVFVKSGSRYTGRMGNYFSAQTTNGLSTTITGTATANDIGGTP
jgi:hypothetical protein